MMITTLITLWWSLFFPSSPQRLRSIGDASDLAVHSLSHYSCIQKVLLMMSFAMADFSPIFPLHSTQIQSLDESREISHSMHLPIFSLHSDF